MSSNPPKPVVLCILDGWGLRDAPEGNAPALAETPHYDALFAAQTPAMLGCSGEDVGLPDGQMGNSEVGHTNIGAGRVVWMDLPRIDKAIQAGEFAASDRLAAFADALNASGGTAHLMGLCSDGGVHAHHRHIAAAAKALEGLGVPVALHLFTDGRDTAPDCAAAQITAFDAAREGAGTVATVSGRYFAMDRDKRWDRVARAFAALVTGTGETAATAAEAVEKGAARGETDEFLAPTVIGDYDGMAKGDGVFFLNFRADRARQLLSALIDPDFDGFDVSARPGFAAALGMVEYSDRLTRFAPAMFPAEDIPNTLGAWVAGAGLRQLRLAETEKYPHVTFFLNGGEEAPFDGEDRHMAQSPDVATYDLAPEMAAAEVTERLVRGIGEGYDLIVVNYANPDMVGHTGDLNAAIRACGAVDRGLGAALAALKAAGGAMIITADHGNCEQMIDPETGGPHTAHTTTPVAALLAGGPTGAALAGPGRLADLAPTLLDLMGLAPPPEMSGRSLLKRP